jgi:hypothetical protein
MTTDVNGYVSLVTAARLLDVSYWQLSYYVRRNKIEKKKLDGRTTLIRLADLTGLKAR